MHDVTHPTLDRLLRDRAWLVALARRIVVDPEIAEDVVQDAAVIAMTRPPLEPAAARSWLARVVRNLGLNRLRGSTRRRAHEDATPPARGPRSPDDLAAEWEVRQRTVEAVLALDEPYRETVLLRFFEGLTGAETAERQGVSEEAVKTRQRRAFAMLRTKLEERRGGRAALLLLAGPALERTSPGLETAVAAGWGGVLVMTGLKKLIVAAVALLGFVVGGTMLATSGGGKAPRPGAAVADGDGDGGGRVHTARAEQIPDPEPPPGVEVGARVDFSEIDRQLDLHGLVVDENGAPVAGASVAAVTRPGWQWDLLDLAFYELEVAGPATIADAGGRFALRLARGETVDLRVTADGRAEVLLPRVQAGARVRIVLPPAAPLDVYVRDADGTPVAGALVRGRRRGRTGPQIELNAMTDADGHLHVPHLPAGSEAWLRVTANGFVDAPPQTVASGEQERIDIVLERGFDISGVIVDAVTAAPVVGAVVGRHWVQQHAVTSDDEGRFTIPGAGAVRDVHATHADYARGSAIVAEGQELRIELQSGDVIVGTVVDRDGATVVGAFVHAIGTRGPRQQQALSVGSARTDADGAFRIEGLSREFPHALFVIARGHGRYVAEFGPRAAGPGEIDLGVLRPPQARAIVGQVLGPDALPLPSRDVTLKLPVPAAAGDHADSARIATDDLGRFAFSDLGPGTYVVSAADETYGAVRAVVEIVAGAESGPVVLQYAPELAAGTFTVRVIDESGMPVPDVRLSLEFDGAQGKNVSTNADGVARADVPGAVVLVSPYVDRSQRFVRADPVHPARGSAGVELILRRGETISGVAVDRDGQPVEKVQVSAHWTDGYAFPREGYTKADGRFTLTVPRGVTAELRAQVMDRDVDEPDTLSGSLRGVTAGTTDVRVEMSLPVMDGTITVLLLAPDGTPLANEKIMTNPPGGRRWVRQETDATGRAHFTGLPRVDLDFFGYWLSGASGGACISDRYAAPSPARGVPDGQEIVMQLEAAAEITGTFVDTDGTPISGARVTARSGLVFANAVTDRDGRFLLLVRASQAGPYRLDVRWKGPGDASHDLAGRAGGVMAGDRDVRVKRIVR